MLYAQNVTPLAAMKFGYSLCTSNKRSRNTGMTTLDVSVLLIKVAETRE
jgi:hypothetical protein